MDSKMYEKKTQKQQQLKAVKNVYKKQWSATLFYEDEWQWNEEMYDRTLNSGS